MTDFIKTKRLKLRQFQNQDLDLLFDYRNNLQCSQYQRWSDTSYEQLEHFIEKYQKDTFGSMTYEQHYAISLLDNHLIGDLSVFVNSAQKCITIGYTISYQHMRQGYAFEMLTSVLCYLKVHYPQHEIVALVEPENYASIHLLEKLKFKHDVYSPQINSHVYVLK